MPDAPEISVIVGAYNRQQFLPSAVRSLLAQTLPRERFEIVVIKNFRSVDSDRELANAGAVVLFDDEPGIGRWLRAAIRASHAPLITFCDDDDEYEPERLERVLEVFRQRPDVGFYRNRVRAIDIESQPLPENDWAFPDRDPGFDKLGAVYRSRDRKADLLEIATRQTRATFATSTMALRRELLDGDLGDSFERTQLEDLFLFLVGVLSPCGIYLDDRRLTRYRRYPGNVSRAVRWFGHAVRSEGEMADVAERHGHPEWARWLRSAAVNHERLYQGGTLVARVSTGAPRREVARRTAEYLRFLAKHPEERVWTLDIWAAAVYGVGYLTFPPLARGVARARLSARGMN